MTLVVDVDGIIDVNFVVDWLAQQPDESVKAKDHQDNLLAKAEHFA